MTPDQYVDRYHSLRIEDQKMKLAVTLQIQKYEAGWSTVSQKEATAVLDNVARKCCKLKGGNAELGPTFNINYDPRVDPTEEFWCMGIRRAFASRGSLAEMTDALRLAVLGGRTTLRDATAYAQYWFGQDCNSFVANYLGISPMIGIRRYAAGSTLDDGQGRDLVACKDLLPLKPREDPAKVVTGDVIVSYGIWQKDKGRWCHIALVQGLTLSGAERKEGKATVRDGRISMPVWGGAAAATHKTGNAPVKVITDVLGWTPNIAGVSVLQDDLAKELPGKKLVGFIGSFKNQRAIRFFLDASTLDDIDHRGWHIGYSNVGN